MQYDVIIAGGGMVGAALGCLLGQAGKRVAVLEARLPTAFSADDDFDLRVSAISRASQRLLVEAGAWDGVVTRRTAPYEAMHVWDATGDGNIRFDAADVGEPDLGHIVENRVVQAALLDALATYDCVDVLCPARLASFTVGDEQVDEQVSVTLDNGDTLRAALLVGADGARSQVRTLAQIDWQPQDYGQKGLVCVARTELAHQATAWQRFMPSGPLAFLPLADEHVCSIVWSLPSDRADALLAMGQTQFQQELAAALDYKLGDVTAVSQRAAFPLRGAHAEQYVSERVALVGDAAHTIHPLAGQGVNLGFKDAQVLAEQLLATRAGADLGNLKVLRRYERARRGDNALTQKAMEGFKLLFGNTLTPWQVLRNAGLNQVDRLPVLKYELARRAMGI